MAFHDTRLPEEIERGSQGGPRFNTSVLTLSSGYEYRNINWSRTRAMYSVGYGIQTKADYDDVLAFFYARQGRAHSFRFKDWSDFEITDQAMFTTDGSTNQFYLFKRYSSGGITYDRYITKPVGSGWTATANAVAKTVVYDTPPGADQIRLDTLTGLVTLGSNIAATSSEVVNMTGEFDVPCRFDNDMIEVNMQTFDAGAIPQITIVEVRGE